MPLDNPTSGFNMVPEYQVSALPWMISSIVTNGTFAAYEFSHFTKWIVVKNTLAGSTVRVAVTLNGFNTNNSNYFDLIGGESITLDWRVKRLFASGSVGSPSVSVIAGLTMISGKQWPYITGSVNGTSSWNGVG